MVSGASKTFKVLMEAVFCFKDALEGVDCSAVFLASCGKLFQQHDELVGKDVILYALLRSDVAVAKGTIISTDPKSTLGDVALGNQYCEVVVNVVLKRVTVLPRPYGYVETMADAHKMSIAWPYKRLKVTKGSQSTQGTTGIF